MLRYLLLGLLVFPVLSCKKASPQRGEPSAATNSAPSVKDESIATSTSTATADVGKKPDEPGGKVTPPAPTLETGDLNVVWQHGSADCSQNQDPPLQVHAYNKNLTIMRQNKCLNFEGPFLYLIFGANKALLLDTGATASATTFPLRTRVETLLVEHYGAANRPNINLIVAHTHAHGDHRAADPQFTGQPATTLVGTGQAAVANFFGIQNWPDQIVDYDLGGRVLQVIPVPGHEASHIALYDGQTGILFTGDTLYPGRIYVQDWAALRLSATRLAKFIENRPVSKVLGTHIELTKTVGVDYPTGTTFQPDEHALALSKETVLLFNTELQKIGPQPMRKVLPDFIISP